MSDVIEIKGTMTLTNRYQVTIPRVLRDALNMLKHDKLIWTIKNHGVFLTVKRTDGRPDVPPPPPVEPAG